MTEELVMQARAHPPPRCCQAEPQPTTHHLTESSCAQVARALNLAADRAAPTDSLRLSCAPGAALAPLASPCLSPQRQRSRRSTNPAMLSPISSSSFTKGFSNGFISPGSFTKGPHFVRRSSSGSSSDATTPVPARVRDNRSALCLSSLDAAEDDSFAAAPCPRMIRRGVSCPDIAGCFLARLAAADAGPAPS